MNLLFGYTILEKLGETDRSAVYRGRKAEEENTIIIKIINGARPSPAETARFRQEYDKIRNLGLDVITATRDVIDHPNGLALILEDFNGTPLSRDIRTYGADISRFLGTAIAVSDALAVIHKHGIVHRNLKPDNILYNPETGEFRITDFGIIQEYLLKSLGPEGKEIPVKSLVYFSPEQTGRISGKVDLRSDIYSLGVTFYELLTGIVPFPSADPIEIIHSHVARDPVPPRELNASVPPMLSDVVMKLLAKTPEERYQSCTGLLADLLRCRDRLRESGTIERFPLGEADFSETLSFPSVFFGRERELDAIIGHWKNVRVNGKAFIFIKGESGSGKTALMNESTRLLSAGEGFILKTELNEASRDIPYGMILPAFTGLMKQLMTEPADKLDQWKSKISRALGNKGKVITDHIPELGMIIGKQEEIPALGMEESLNRFLFVFKQLLGVFCSVLHPMALFLDDIHRADSSTIDLLQAISIDPSINHIMIIGSYSEDTPRLSVLRKTVAGAGIPAAHMELPLFSAEHIGKIIALTVKKSGPEVGVLAEVTYNKTGGNAHAVYQLLTTAHDEGLLSVDPGKGWIWDIDAIRRLTITDNVVELLVKKISHLPDPVQDILAKAACIGPRFDPEILAVLSGQTPESLPQMIEPALRHDIIEMRDEVYEFSHNKIRDTIYSLIDTDEKSRMHLAIGRILDNKPKGDESDDRIYAIVNQINLGRLYISGDGERINAAQLNRKAALRSYDSGAYETALHYAAAGISLIGEGEWESHYELTKNLYKLLAECEYINGNSKKADACFEELIGRCRTRRERAMVHLDRSRLFMGIGNYRKATAESIKGLEMMGVRLRTKPGHGAIIAEMIKMRVIHRPRTMNGLKRLPSLKDKNVHLTINLLSELALSSYFTDIRLMFVAIIKIVSLSLRYGNSSFSAFAYCWYGLFISVFLGNPGRGYRYGTIAMEMNDIYLNPRYCYITSSTFGLFHNHWKNHISASMEFFERNITAAQETGDLSYAGYIAGWITWTGVVMGEKLDVVIGRCREQTGLLEMFRSGNEYVIYPVIGYVLNLKGKNGAPGVLDHGQFKETIFQRIRNKSLLYVYYLLKCHSHLFYGEYGEALTMIEMMGKNLEGALGLSSYPLYFFYSGIAGARMTDDSRGRRKQLARCLGKIARWSRLCPENFEHMKLLLEAETARLSGKNEAASLKFDLSIEAARKGRFHHHEALACELAGLFYLAMGRKTIARAYMRDARNAYLNWGADGIVSRMDARYPELALSYDGAARGSPHVSGSASSGTLHQFDIAALLRTAAEISSEIHLEHLIVNIMRIILLNAGAQRGVLMMNREGKLAIEAEGDMERDRMSVFPSLSVYDSGRVPESVIRYVERSWQSVILENAAEDGLFNDDPYIRSRGTKSVLCFPMIRQDNLEGIIYLENNAAAKTFTAEQIQVLQLLGTQAAVSLQNAMLYEKTHNTEQILARQYEEIQSQYEELEAMNEALTETHDELQDANYEMGRMRYFLQNIIDSMPSIIISIDQEKTINLWNREAERAIGIDSASAVGMPIHRAIPFFVTNGGIIDTAITEGRVQKSEKVMNLTGRSQSYHDIAVYPLSGKSGAGAVLRIDDITARVNIESMMVQTEKMMSIGGLAAGMAHEINNPLGGILMSAQNIVRRVSSDIKGNRTAADELGIDLETVRRYLERRGILSMIGGIQEMGARASKIVENMLAYSRKSDSIKLPVRIRELIERTVDLASKEYNLAKKYDFKHITIIREFTREDMIAPCISTEIEQVMLNLLKNAAQAMMGEEARMKNPVITLRLFKNRGTIQIEVEDNGPGMTAEQCRRAFEPFYTTKKAGKGTGLGLSVSYFIVTENHGGSMKVISSPGEGARFIINIPL